MALSSPTFLLLLSPSLVSATIDVPTRAIAPNVNMPVLSIGTGGLESKSALEIVSNWMSIGGLGIDTAVAYRDQDVVGKVVAESGVARKDVFITTKMPGCHHLPDNNADHWVQYSLQQLGTDYADLMLIHFPECQPHFMNCSDLSKWNCSATWATMEKYHKQGVLKAIGVSNFERKHLEPLLSKATVTPAVNQIQHNVLAHDDATIAFSQAHNITIEAYSPLGRSNHSGDITGNAAIKTIATSHNVSTYQVAIRWIIQHGHILTFQSTSKEHQRSDADVFSFSLTDQEMSTLDNLQSSLEVVV